MLFRSTRHDRKKVVAVVEEAPVAADGDFLAAEAGAGDVEATRRLEGQKLTQASQVLFVFGSLVKSCSSGWGGAPLVCCPVNTFTKSLDFGENRIGRSGPDERL